MMKALHFVSLCIPALACLYIVSVDAAGNQEDVIVDNIGTTNFYNTTRKRYYCTFRNMWTPERQPANYPLNGRWSAPFLFTHILEFESWEEGESITVGLEKVAETGFTDVLVEQIDNAGDQTYSYAQPQAGFFTQTDDFIHIPPIEVSGTHPYLTAVAAMIPSPDWFTGFYDFWLVEENTRMWFDHLLIQTYPWDAGTDSGDDYNSVESDLFYAEPVTKFTTRNAPSGNIFVSPDGSSVPPVAEWECFLRLGDEDLILPDCDYFKDPCCNATEGEECNDEGILGSGEIPADRNVWYDEPTSAASPVVSIPSTLGLLLAGLAPFWLL